MALNQSLLLRTKAQIACQNGVTIKFILKNNGIESALQCLEKLQTVTTFGVDLGTTVC